jgi:hypothetical protein
MQHIQSGTRIIPLRDAIHYDGRTFTAEEFSWTGYRAVHITERPSDEDWLGAWVTLPLDVADKIAVAILRHLYDYPPLVDALNAIEPDGAPERKEIDGDGCTARRLTERLDTPKTRTPPSATA